MFYWVMPTVTVLELTVPPLVDGAEAVAFNITGASDSVFQLWMPGQCSWPWTCRRRIRFGHGDQWRPM